MTRRKELEENTEEIKNMLTYMFKAVFVHRYRYDERSHFLFFDMNYSNFLFKTEV